MGINVVWFKGECLLITLDRVIQLTELPISDAEVVWKLFNEMLLIYEGKEGWSLPNEEKFQSLSNSIKFFCIESPKFEAKFKFNQNKTPEDVKSVIDSLESNGETEASIFMRNCQNG